MKVKLIWVEEIMDDETYFKYSIARCIEEESFEEISENDFLKLSHSLYRLKNPFPNFYPKLVILDEVSLITRLEDIQKELDKQLQKAKQEELDLQKKKKAAAQKKLESKKVLFEKLKKEFEA